MAEQQGFRSCLPGRIQPEGSMAKLRRADYDGRTFQATLRYTFF
jgi:hypothetical protein